MPNATINPHTNAPVLTDAQIAETEIPDDDDEHTDCAACGDRTHTDELVTAWNRRAHEINICQSCADDGDNYVAVEYRCRGEPAYVHSDHAVYASDSECYATETYAQRNWCYSDVDGNWYSDSDNAPSGYDDDDDDDSGACGGRMYEYHSTNVLMVHGWPSVTPKQSLCFGVELEMESTNESTSELCGALGGRNGNGSYILMSDGSLAYGTELITLPYTLEHHQTAFGWKSVLAPLADIAKSGAGTTNCGIHIHVNRKAISALTLGKMLVFINSQPNIPYVKAIAQRNPASWAAFKDKKITDGRAYSDARYEALNVGDSTVEFRIFRGNLRPERVLKNIEFCHAVVSFARDTSMINLTWESFAKFITQADNRKLYSHLINFIQEKLTGALPATIGVQFNDSEEV